MGTFLALFFVFTLVGYYLHNRLKINKVINFMFAASDLIGKDGITKEELDAFIKKFREIIPRNWIEENIEIKEKEIDEEDIFFKNLEEFKEYDEEIENEKVF